MDNLNNSLTGFLFWLLLAVIFTNSAMGEENMTKKEFSLWEVDKFKSAPAVAVPLYPSSTRETLSLDGKWQVKMDPKDEGFTEEWFAKKEIEFPSLLNVPGNWNALGLGGSNTPPEKEWKNTPCSAGSMWAAGLKGSYIGLSWYRKSIVVPKDWEDKEIRLIFGGIMSSLRLWINGEFVGGRWTDGNSFYFDVTKQVKLGQSNTFVMAMDNRWKNIATISHYNWYTPAGGPFHHIMLSAIPKLYIESAIVRPVLDGPDGPGTAEVHINIVNMSNTTQQANIDVEISEENKSGKQFSGSSTISISGGQAKKIILPIKIDPVRLWSWNTPRLYKLAVHLKGKDIKDTVLDRFGMRTVESIKNRFEVNKRPVFIRGQHFNFFWPNKLSPPITKEEYVKVLKLMKDYGFNYLRTPWLMPEECYQAADELGMMLQLEFPYAFKPFDQIKRQLIKRLIEECLIAYGNHPSLILLCMSNEGSCDGTGSLNKEFCDYAKTLDPTRLVMDTDGGSNPNISEVVALWTHGGVWSNYMARVACGDDVYNQRPVIDHEFLNVPSLYNPEIIKYFGDGVLSGPPNLFVMLQHIRQQGLEKEYPLFVKASHHHQANFIKEGMERARKHSLKAGFSMCAWNDIEPNVYWGIMDAVMNPKGITADEMRRYNDENVLLADFIDPVSGNIQLVPDYCRCYGQNFIVQPYVSYYAAKPLKNAKLLWTVEAKSGKILSKGMMENISLTSYKVTSLPQIDIGPMAGTVPQNVELTMELSDGKTKLKNSWPIWLFPEVKKGKMGRKIITDSQEIKEVLVSLVEEIFPPDKDYDKSGLWITDKEESALAWLKENKKVLFLASSQTAFDPGWFRGAGFMGGIIRPDSLLGDFPHDKIISWQFRNLIGKVADNKAKMLENLQIIGRPIISNIFGESSINLSHQLWVVEPNTGGHLTYCSLRVLTNRIEANYLFQQLLKNAGSN